MIGIDTTQISRMAKSLKSEPFVSRVFTDSEVAYCKDKPNAAASFAGVFCAKEAAAKAIGKGFGTGLMPHDIEVRHTASGAPYLEFKNGAAQLFCGMDAELSISHDGDHAVAVVILKNRSGESAN